MSAPTTGAPPETDPEAAGPAADRAVVDPADRHGRALAVGLAVAVVLGVAFGQFTGTLSDTVTGVRDMSAGDAAGAGAAGSQGVPAPPTSLPPTSLRRSSLTTTGTVPASSTTTAVATPATAPAGPLVPPGVTLGPGAQGPAVRRLEGRLAELGYWPGEADGAYGEPTRQAVRAFQKAEGLDARDGLAGAEVGRRLAAASFAWGRSRSGTVVEVDRVRQLLLIVEDGAVRWTLDAATGPLPRGRYTVEREIDGRYEAPAGTVHRPRYFDGSVAIQGTGATPRPPAQGCACVSDAAMDFLWSTGAVGVGTPVLVY